MDLVLVGLFGLSSPNRAQTLQNELSDAPKRAATLACELHTKPIRYVGPLAGFGLSLFTAWCCKAAKLAVRLILS